MNTIRTKLAGALAWLAGKVRPAGGGSGPPTLPQGGGGSGPIKPS